MAEPKGVGDWAVSEPKRVGDWATSKPKGARSIRVWTQGGLGPSESGPKGVVGWNCI